MDVDFYTLARPVQDRFADATRSIGLPAPLAQVPPRDRRTVFWAFLAVAAAVSVCVWVPRGVGDLSNPTALPPISHAAGYAILIAASVFCLLQALASRGARARLPYEPGLYLFPAGVYDARESPIRVFRHPDMRTVEAGGGALRVKADGGDFVFTFPDAEGAERAKALLDEGARHYADALRSENRREQARLDPLVDSGFSSPFSPQARLTRAVPLWARLSIVVAVAAGAALGPAVWKVRNLLSERSLYAAARVKDDEASYRAYLARGGTRQEVAEILLPRCELRAAMAAGTVEAIEAYAAAHSGSRIQGEIDGALRGAVTAELEAARAKGTVSALREFQSRRSKYAFTRPHVEASMVALYRKVLAAATANKDPAVASFFERLLGYTKGHGPAASVRFYRRIPDSVSEADAQVKLSAYFMGKQSIPSQYFVGDYAERREQAAGKALIAAFSTPFPGDMLALELKAPVVDGTPPGPPPEPTLAIDYTPEMSGGYMSPKPRGVFVGVGMTFRASFQIPGDTQPLEFKFSLWRTPNPQILMTEGTTTADVYEKMASDGFDKFVKGFVDLLSGSAS